ncbi:MAG: IS30 family transposase [Gemmatimonadaceae bacterium]
MAEKLKDDWSPQQVAGWLRVSFGDDSTMRVSHETIYRSLFIQARGVLHKALITRLRSKRTMRRAKHFTTAGQDRGRIRDALSIRDRPAEIDARTSFGHWEGDLMAGARNTHLATLVERRSRYTVPVRVKGKDSSTVVQALVRQVKKLLLGRMTSLTWDRGTELAEHESFSAQTAAPVYFYDPQSPWQRGTNESTNGLLRQYFS